MTQPAFIQRTIFGSQFSDSTTWVLWIELKSSCLVVGTFNQWNHLMFTGLPHTTVNFPTSLNQIRHSLSKALSFSWFQILSTWQLRLIIMIVYCSRIIYYANNCMFHIEAWRHNIFENMYVILYIYTFLIFWFISLSILCLFDYCDCREIFC